MPARALPDLDAALRRQPELVAFLDRERLVERVQLLRKAFQETMKDPEFLADAKKSRLDIDPVSAEELEKTVAQLFKLDPAVVAKLNQIFSMK